MRRNKREHTTTFSHTPPPTPAPTTTPAQVHYMILPEFYKDYKDSQDTEEDYEDDFEYQPDLNNDNTDTDDDTEEYSGDYDNEDIVPLANSDNEGVFGYENPLENSDQSSVSANVEESISELETDNSDSSHELNDPDDGPRMFFFQFFVDRRCGIAGVS